MANYWLTLVFLLLQQLVGREAAGAERVVGQIRSAKYPDKCLDVPSASNVPGTAVALWDCHDGIGQKFRVDGRRYRYMAEPLLCLDAGDMKEGTKLTIQECKLEPAQIFDQHREGSASHGQLSVQGQHRMCLDVPGAANDNGNELHFWSCSDAMHQKWDYPLQTRVETYPPETLMFIRNAGFVSRCFDALGGSNEDGTPIAVFDCHGGQHQQFFVIAGEHKVKYAPDAGKCLGVDRLAVGARIELQDCDDKLEQQFAYDPNSAQGTFYSTSQNEALCFDLLKGDFSNGERLMLNKCRGSVHQSWHAVPVDDVVTNMLKANDL